MQLNQDTYLRKEFEPPFKLREQKDSLDLGNFKKIQYVMKMDLSKVVVEGELQRAHVLLLVL